MKKLNDFFEKHFIPFAVKLNNIKGLIAIRDAFIQIFPLTFVGSIAVCINCVVFNSTGFIGQLLISVIPELDKYQDILSPIQNGTINIMYETIEECRYQLGYILDIYYNVANKVKNPIYELQNNILPLKNQPYDILKVIKGIVDADSILEISSSYAQNLVTSFARINGKSIGIVANQPKVLAGAIDCMAAEKGKNFLEKCRKLKLPLLVIVDVPSFLPGKEQERAGIEKKGGQFIKEMICLDTVKISLILHKSYGGAYIAMNCIALGADKVYSWPKSSIGIMGQSAEEEVCFDSSARQNTSEYGKYIEQGCVSEIVEPEETRDKLIKEFCSI